MMTGIMIPNKKYGRCFLMPSRFCTKKWEHAKYFYEKNRDRNLFQTANRWKKEYEPIIAGDKRQYFSIYKSVRGWTMHFAKHPEQKSKRVWKKK